MTATPGRRAVRHAPPGRVLWLSLVVWGLGELARGRTETALIWMAAEVAALALVLGSAVWLADGTLYLVPFLLGSTFIAVWAAQAVISYRHAQRDQQAVAPAPAHSPAGAIVWLCVPMLIWGTAFWLLAAGAATPAAVLDRFVASWPAASNPDAWPDRLVENPAALGEAADEALRRLAERCREMGDECEPDHLLRDVRIRIVSEDGHRATAVAEVVRYERRPTRVFGLFAGRELVPVPEEHLLTLELATAPEIGPAGLDVGARRWMIVGSEG